MGNIDRIGLLNYFNLLGEFHDMEHNYHGQPEVKSPLSLISFLDRLNVINNPCRICSVDMSEGEVCSGCKLFQKQQRKYYYEQVRGELDIPQEYHTVLQGMGVTEDDAVVITTYFPSRKFLAPIDGYYLMRGFVKFIKTTDPAHLELLAGQYSGTLTMESIEPVNKYAEWLD